MPALKPTDFTARITWLGYVPDRDHSLRAEPLKQADLTWTGIAGEAHGGINRRSCSRVISQYPRGTEIRNVRQLSVLSAEELAKIADAIGADYAVIVGVQEVAAGMVTLRDMQTGEQEMIGLDDAVLQIMGCREGEDHPVSLGESAFLDLP